MSSGSSPLGHIVQHPIVQKEADVGLLTPEGVVTVWSDHISMIVLAGFLLMLLVPRSARRRAGDDEVGRLVPTGSGNMLEALCELLRTHVARPMLHEHTDRFIKYLWSVFFFILTMNLLGLLPLGVVTTWAFGTHIGGTATANIWVTATLALMTLLMIVVNGLRFGGVDWIKHFSPGPLWLAPLLIPIEILALVAKIFALTVRLFANMVAGHTLLAVLLSFILGAGAAGYMIGFAISVPVVVGSVAIMMLEILVAFIQAFIFTFLTAVFIGQAVILHHDDHHEEAHA